MTSRIVKVQQPHEVAEDAQESLENFILGKEILPEDLASVSSALAHMTRMYWAAQANAEYASSIN